MSVKGDHASLGGRTVSYSCRIQMCMLAEVWSSLYFLGNNIPQVFLLCSYERPDFLIISFLSGELTCLVIECVYVCERLYADYLTSHHHHHRPAAPVIV